MNTTAPKSMTKGGSTRGRKGLKGGDASTFAQSVYGGIGQQQPVSPSNNVIAANYVPNMQGGRKRRRTKKRRIIRKKSKSSNSKMFKLW